MRSEERKYSEIPKYNELEALLRLREKCWRFHKWMKEQIEVHSLEIEKANHHFPARYRIDLLYLFSRPFHAQIRTVSRCTRCGAIKRTQYRLYDEWERGNAAIIFPIDSRKDVCTTRPSEKVFCPICERHFSKDSFDAHYQFELAERRKGEQRKQNLGIIKKVGLRNFRAKLAIYRLYRYCDLSPHWISVAIENIGVQTKENRIRDIVGEVFKALCVVDDKCVFKKLLESEVKT